MNILLSRFYFKTEYFFDLHQHFYKWLLNYFPKEKIDVKFFVPENCKELFLNSKELFVKTTPIFVSKTDLENIFGENSDDRNYVYKKFYKTGLTEKEKTKYEKFVKTSLGSWEPDIVVVFGCFSSFKIWSGVFPNALCITQEDAIFTRPPFFRTLIHDPYNSLPDNCMVKFADDIKKFKISRKENREVENFKKKLTSLIDKTSFIDNEMIKYKKQFRKLVLLPLVSSTYAKLFDDAIYTEEKELIEYVMQNTPSDVGVFVTQHNIFKSLEKEDIEYFSNKYKNFLFLKSTDSRKFVSNSMYYFKHIDAVLNTTSKTALMALLWDKPILSLAKTANELIKDGQGMEELDKVLHIKPKKNNIIYWYFTHYLLLEPDFTTENYMYENFKQKLNYYRSNGIDFNYFNKINSMEDVNKKITGYVEKQTKEQKNTSAFNGIINMLKQKMKKFVIIILLTKN